MKIPADVALDIVEYRDFHDVPRLILAKDSLGCFWALDSRFSDELDEYESSYRVFFLGADKLLAHSLFERGAGDEAGLSPAEVLSVSLLTFDETKRKSFQIRRGMVDRTTS